MPHSPAPFARAPLRARGVYSYCTTPKRRLQPFPADRPAARGKRAKNPSPPRSKRGIKAPRGGGSKRRAPRTGNFCGKQTKNGREHGIVLPAVALLFDRRCIQASGGIEKRGKTRAHPNACLRHRHGGRIAALRRCGEPPPPPAPGARDLPRMRVARRAAAACGSVGHAAIKNSAALPPRKSPRYMWEGPPNYPCVRPCAGAPLRRIASGGRAALRSVSGNIRERRTAPAPPRCGCALPAERGEKQKCAGGQAARREEVPAGEYE